MAVEVKSIDSQRNPDRCKCDLVGFGENFSKKKYRDQKLYCRADIGNDSKC